MGGALVVASWKLTSFFFLLVGCWLVGWWVGWFVVHLLVFFSGVPRDFLFLGFLNPQFCDLCCGLQSFGLWKSLLQNLSRRF